MFNVSILRCLSCGSEFEVMDKVWRCSCGGFLELIYEKQFTPEIVAGRDWDIWRYDTCLPVSRRERRVSLGEPCTPLVTVELEGKKLQLKMESMNPTGSFKDRGTAMMINAALLRGIAEIVEDSSGNAGASVAAYCAAAGVKARIFVPEDTSSGKLGLIAAFGAELNKVPGSRQRSVEAALDAAEDIYYASHCWDPFFIEGVKTIAYEIAEQLGWRAPESLYLPVGNGSLLLGVFRGFRELKELGVVSELPVIHAVQAKGCAPIYSCWAGEMLAHEQTMAEGIAVQEPPRLEEIIAAVDETGGEFSVVSDEEIKMALRAAFSKGIILEPTSGVAIAAAIKSSKDGGNSIVPVTGNGLKSLNKLVDLI